MPRVTHISSAHRVSDPRIHLREAASLGRAGYDVALVANAHDVELPTTGVTLHTLRKRGRLARMTLGSLEAVRLGLTTKPDIVHLHDPELVWSIIPLRLRGIKVIYDAHEDLPQQVLSKSYLNRFTVRPATWLSHVALKLAAFSNLVVAATETIAERFPAHKTVLVRNFPTLRLADGASPVTERANAVGYVGVMAAARGSEAMVRAFGHTDFPDDWKAIVAGSSSPDSYLDDLRGREGWKRVDYRGLLSSDAARDLLNECKVGIVTLRRTPAYLDSLPTKMFEYFAAGVPAIASDFPLWRSIIEKHDCGILVDEESPEEIARAVRRYAENPDLLFRHSRNALQAALGELNWEHEEAALIAGYARLAQPSAPKAFN